MCCFVFADKRGVIAAAEAEQARMRVRMFAAVWQWLAATARAASGLRPAVTPPVTGPA
ncbi:MAG: hypothetical protein AB7N54_18545 [Alphaproteobacteria bacterium]